MTTPEAEQEPRPRLALAIMAVGAAAIVALVTISLVMLAKSDNGGEPAATDDSPASSDRPRPTPSEPATTQPPADVEFRRVIEVIPEPDDCAEDGVWCNADESEAYRLGRVELRTRDIVAATAAPDRAGGFTVTITLSSRAAERFEELTTELAEKLGARSQLAIVVDDVVMSAPSVLDPITTGEVQITGNFARAEAEGLAGAITP